jgi:ATP-binding cassette, subfamily B, multidrug efflux pump
VSGEPRQSEQMADLTAAQRLALARRTLAYARPYLRWMIAALALILVHAAAVNILPVLIKQATDLYLVETEEGLLPYARWQGLRRLGLLYLLVALCSFLLRYAQGLLTAWIGQRIIFDLRADVYRKGMRLDTAYYDRTPVGRLMTRVTSDVEALQRFVTEGVVGTLADILMLLGVLGFMIYLSPPLAGTVLLILPVMFAVLAMVNRKLRRAHRMIRERTTVMNAFLQESIVGMNTIQLFNRERQAEIDFDQRNEHLREAHREEVRWFSLYYPALEIFQAIAVMLILAAGGWFILKDSTLVSIGVVIAFLTYVRNFFQPLGSLSDKASTFQRALASAERLFGLLDTPESIANPAEPVEIGRIWGAITFRDVWFAYQDEQWVIRGLNLSVRPGEHVAVIGATGAGKSTLIHLIARFYDVQRGSVSVDDTDVRLYRKEDLRRRIGIVMQEPFIFSGPVIDNITLFNPDITREAAEEAARAVRAHEFIRELPRGYDTQLTERGGGLSLGQKQLIVLARTLAQNPEMLFVLDEATASVDTETEQRIQAGMEALMRGRTSIIIAHRLSTIRHADQIVVMKHGELVAQGRHEELLAQRGYYWQLYRLLFQEDAPANDAGI